MRRRSSLSLRAGQLVPLLLALSLLFPLACGKSGKKVVPCYTDNQRLQLDTTRNYTRNVDSVLRLVNRYRDERDAVREMAALAELGHACRAASRYADAIKAHQRQLHIAGELRDTLMTASALNDLGVNYRRMGLYYEGLSNHITAAETTFSDDSCSAKLLKCRAIAYNGAGNAYLSVGYYKKADDMLRRALDLERQLGSHMGQNVDCSNIGMVYEARGMADSARIYYNRALYHSRMAGSRTGVAYCYMNFGSLSQKGGDMERALYYYRLALDGVDRSRDSWLWLQPCIALAGAFAEAGMVDSAEACLHTAEATARQVGTREFDGKIYVLLAECSRRRGDYPRAYNYLAHAKAAEDTMRSVRRLFEIETLHYETASRREAQERAAADARLRDERAVKWLFVAGCAVFFVLAVLLLRLSVQRKRANRIQRGFIRMRESVFTNITHEFRTPLTLILALSRELYRDNGGEVAQKARNIERQGESLLSLVNRLLDIQRIRSATVPVQLREGNLTSCVEMIVEGYTEYARGRGIDLRFASRERVEAAFSPEYLEKIVNNLLSNAFKFTPDGGRIGVMMWREGRRAYIEVSDTGAGITPDALPYIFKPFYRAKEAAGRAGYGIGLPLAREATEAMGGTLTAKSEVGEGSVFRLTLPLPKHGKAADTAEDTAAGTPGLSGPLLPPADGGQTPGGGDKVSPAPAAAADSAGGRRTAVLVVEDNRSVAAYIGSLFSAAHDVLYACDGAEGMEKAVKHLPDLVITDLLMPNMGGEDFCRRLRADSRTAHIPVIVVTACVTDEDRMRSLEAGADAYLAKPFRSEELLAHAARLLRRGVPRDDTPDSGAAEAAGGLSRYKAADKQFLVQVADAVRRCVAENGSADVQAVAERLCMSPSSLYRRMTSLTGYTPAAYIQRVKVKAACRLLDANPSESLASVAERCGFGDYSSFVRAFRNVCGLTPSQYARRCD